MGEPSKNWYEQVGTDEEARFAAYTERIVALQERFSRRLGNGRAFHRRPVMGLRGSFEVLPDLPDQARHGLFAQPATYETTMRLSNAAINHQPDHRPDIRGYAIKVHGVSGKSALGDFQTTQQDFALINIEAFSSATSEEFIHLIEAASRGVPNLVKDFIRRFGFFGGLKRLRHIAKLANQRFTGFATEPFYSAAPLACGPYAVRVRLAPASSHPRKEARRDWAGDMRSRLAEGALVHDFQLQFFVDEATTPIENASVVWSPAKAPYVTVARLTVPQQSFEGDEASKFAAEIEADKFDPWNALADHRPLGEVMRARKAAYLASQRTRGAAA